MTEVAGLPIEDVLDTLAGWESLRNFTELTAGISAMPDIFSDEPYTSDHHDMGFLLVIGRTEREIRQANEAAFYNGYRTIR